jgi:protein involved in polysaccharide export with SLBB domain
MMSMIRDTLDTPARDPTMEPGEDRLYRQRLCRLGAALLLLLPVSCASQPFIDRALLAERGSAIRNEGVPEAYRCGCPDVLEFNVAGRPDLTGRREIAPNGRVDLSPVGRVRVEGLTEDEIVARAAEEAGLPPGRLRVRVADYRSQQLYLIGQVMGQQRAVPYQGPETVLDLLKRTGGITAGAAPESVFVVRSRVAEGSAPEVFHIDLQAVITGRNTQTNIRLLPSDQIFVGENRRSSLEKCLPPWLRPAYVALSGLHRAPQRPAELQVPQGPDRTWAGRSAGRVIYRGAAE